MINGEKNEQTHAFIQSKEENGFIWFFQMLILKNISFIFYARAHTTGNFF